MPCTWTPDAEPCSAWPRGFCHAAMPAGRGAGAGRSSGSRSPASARRRCRSRCAASATRPRPACGLSDIVRADLQRSGLFRLVDVAPVPLDERSLPALADWRARGVDALVAGSVTRLADGRFDVRYKLWDAVRARS